MPIVTKDEWIDRVERSWLYLIFDLVFSWVGAIGSVLLIVYCFWSYWSSETRPDRIFWLKIGALGIILLSAESLKDLLIAWIGLAPPDYSLWFGPRQRAVDQDMTAIIESQNRGTRISARGYFVDELLSENQKRFERRFRKPK